MINCGLGVQGLGFVDSLQRPVGFRIVPSGFEQGLGDSVLWGYEGSAILQGSFNPPKAHFNYQGP